MNRTIRINAPAVEWQQIDPTTNRYLNRRTVQIARANLKNASTPWYVKALRAIVAAMMKG